ncbi:MAG: hypothetical protein ACE5I3_06990 [Phycisphaerae bacterium]
MSPIMLLANETELKNLTGLGIALMVGCVGFVLALCGFCFWRLTRSTNITARHHVPLDIDTHDRNA